MKVFLAEICCVLLFDLKVRSEKKMYVLLCVYKGFDVMCISVFSVMDKLGLVDLNIYFYDVFF